MGKLIDLTHTIEDLMPVYPGDDETRLVQTKQLDKDKYTNHNLKTGMHGGTHLDGPMHLTESSTYISEVPLEQFIGRGCIIDVSGQSEIKYKEEYEERINEEDIVLLYTGLGKRFGSEEYFNTHPVVDRSLVELFIRKKVKLIGLDMPSPDRYPFEIHRLLFKNNILIIENLANLDKLLFSENFEVIALPLKIKADSSILRVAARI